MTQDEWVRRGSSFGAVASAYADLRPGYPDEAVRWALAPVAADVAGLRVVDLGAGTGILTELLIRLGADVTAVEPDEAMRAEFARRLPSVRLLTGSAEDIPLPDGSADAVLCGQAMHWFDMDRALPEIARVLRPGGVLAGLWNSDDDRVDVGSGAADGGRGRDEPRAERPAGRGRRASGRAVRAAVVHRGGARRVPERPAAHGRLAGRAPSRRTPGCSSWTRPTGTGCSPGSGTTCVPAGDRRAGSSTVPMVTLVLRTTREEADADAAAGR